MTSSGVCHVILTSYKQPHVSFVFESGNRLRLGFLWGGAGVIILFWMANQLIAFGAGKKKSDGLKDMIGGVHEILVDEGYFYLRYNEY